MIKSAELILSACGIWPFVNGGPDQRRVDAIHQWTVQNISAKVLIIPVARLHWRIHSIDRHRVFADLCRKWCACSGCCWQQCLGGTCRFGYGRGSRLGVSVCALLLVGDSEIAAPDIHPNAQADKIKLRITAM